MRTDSGWEELDVVIPQLDSVSGRGRAPGTRRCIVQLCTALGFATFAAAKLCSPLPGRQTVRVALCAVFDDKGWLSDTDGNGRMRRRLLQNMHDVMTECLPKLEKQLPIHLRQCHDPVLQHMSSHIVLEPALAACRHVDPRDVWLSEWLMQTMETVARVSRWRSQRTAETWGNAFCTYVRKSGILCGLVHSQPGPQRRRKCPGGDLHRWSCHTGCEHPVDLECRHPWTTTTTDGDVAAVLTARVCSINTEDRMMRHAEHVLCAVTSGGVHSRARYAAVLQTLFGKVWKTMGLEELSLLLNANGTKFFRYRRAVCDRDNVHQDNNDVRQSLGRQQREQRITDQELHRMLETCECPMLRCMLYILFSTGIRLGALCRIRLLDIVGVDGSIHNILHPFEKNKKRHPVPISAEVAAAVRQWIESHRARTHSPYLFPSRRYEMGHISHVSVALRFQKHALQCGVSRERAHPHATRHTTSMRMIEAGERPEHVQQLLGHDSIETTRRYIRCGPEHLARVHVPPLMAPKRELVDDDWTHALMTAFA